MTQDANNPFVLPGFGQSGDSATNPLFAGLDMMRQTWQNMAGASGIEASALAPMSLEDLERRIRELQAVQNWLQLNATMLGNTIQGLEIQRSTLATLKSFAGESFPLGGAAPQQPPSPKAASTTASAAAAPDASQAAYAQAASDWWQMLQQQFQQIASATTASLQGMAESAQQAQASAAASPSQASKPKAASRPKESPKASAKASPKASPESPKASPKSRAKSATSSPKQ